MFGVYVKTRYILGKVKILVWLMTIREKAKQSLSQLQKEMWKNEGEKQKAKETIGNYVNSSISETNFSLYQYVTNPKEKPAP